MRCGTYLRRDKSVWRDSVTEHSRETRGKLTVFLGAAAGVGKTYTMLETARQRLTEGVDVAVGWVETHGRPEMEQLLDGLPRIAPQEIRLPGQILLEMDAAAIEQRRPQLVLIDDLAHVNAPGSVICAGIRMSRIFCRQGLMFIRH